MNEMKTVRSTLARYIVNARHNLALAEAAHDVRAIVDARDALDGYRTLANTLRWATRNGHIKVTDR